MNGLSNLITKLILLIVVVIFLLVVSFIRASSKRKALVAAENNAAAVGACEVRIEKSEIINRFYDYQMDAFLRRTFNGLKSWNPVHEERVGFKWAGLHVVTCYMLDGNRFNVSVFVKEDHLTPELYEHPEEEAPAVSYEDIAAAWLNKWNTEFATHATQGTGFSIPDTEFPKEEKAVEMILETIIMQGDFATMHDKEDHCYRFAFNAVQ